MKHIFEIKFEDYKQFIVVDGDNYISPIFEIILQRVKEGFMIVDIIKNPLSKKEILDGIYTTKIINTRFITEIKWLNTYT